MEFAGDRPKLYILLALNAGMSQADISSLTSDQIDNKHIRRGRSKTGVFGQWLLWRETKRLLQSGGTSDQSDKYLTHKNQHTGEVTELQYHYRTEKGTMSKYCHVTTSFRNVMRKSKVEGNFYRLRATGANLVQKESGVDVAKLYLAHSGSTIAEKHYLDKDYNQ